MDFFFCYPLFFFVCFFFVFLLYFALFFVNFGGLGLPCHLLCCLLLFVYSFFFKFIFILFLFYFFFLPSWIFWVYFFVSLTALGTSSLRLIVFTPGGCTGAPFRGLVSRGSKLCKWWFGKASGLIDTELMNMVPRKRLTMGCSSPLAGHGWTIWEMVSIALFFFLIFWKSMVIDGWETCFVCCRGQWRPPGWEVNSTVLSGTLFLLRHWSNCGDYWCYHVVRKGGRHVQKYSWIVG